jgi:hypothetical protein
MTHIGRITSGYLPRLKRSRRTSSAMPQMKETILLCVAWSISASVRFLLLGEASPLTPETGSVSQVSGMPNIQPEHNPQPMNDGCGEATKRKNQGAAYRKMVRMSRWSLPENYARLPRCWFLAVTASRLERLAASSSLRAKRSNPGSTLREGNGHMSKNRSIRRSVGASISPHTANKFSHLAHVLRGLLLSGYRVAVYTQSPQFALIARSDKFGGCGFP